jgi:hypothetical protein
MGLCLAGLHARRADFGPSCALCLWSAFVYTGQSNTKVWASFIGGLCQQSGDADKATYIGGDRAMAEG